MDYADALRLVAETLAAECGCTPDELFRPGVHLFARPDERRARPPLARRFPPREPSFAVLSFGNSVVVSASPTLLDAVVPIFAGAGRDEVFGVDRLAAVSDVLLPHALRLVGPSLRLVCGRDSLRPRLTPEGFPVVVELDPPIERVRELGGVAWLNALDGQQIAGSLPTAALAVAYHGARVVGVAAATAEAARLWQIGIDVAADSRGRGVGAALTSALAGHVLAVGKVPWYGVAPANLRSLRTALAAGFRPAWLEVRTISRTAPDSPVLPPIASGRPALVDTEQSS